MEDVNAKRNARRRRILENSEKRLLKITGKDDNKSKAQIIVKDIQKEISSLHVNNEISGIDNTFNWSKNSSPLLLTNRINYILLAVIVNILLILQLDHLFGKTITIPYFPIMLGRLYNYKNTREMQENNLLYTALILCNINPELTYRLKKLVTISRMILGDLALYIFSFTLIHYGFCYYLHNTDIPITLTV
ncbi:uncharacterized protein LOC108004081 [Apis cerana]|uniref:Calcium signal-modulating cyclophilin ligand n=1 Tax=Apis cerana cerana TaxID=94128 RepID=A0A2A3E0A4_APICC|nr:uncharacterized protein LOC108004081 [Apis cerana]PBC25195.1 hypothetical protein APICC_01943 [Apis cerana cerana]